MSDYPRTDRRSQPRTYLQHSISYRRVDQKEPGEAIQTHTLNFSDGGLAFESAEFMELDETLALEIQADPHKPPVQAVAKVAWREKHDGGFRVGVEFLWIGCPSLSMATSMMPLVPWPVL